MGLYEQLQQACDDIIQAYKERTGDGSLSFNDALALAYNATASFVHLVESLSGLSGLDKKENVLLAIGRFYDLVIAPIPLTGLPGPIESMTDLALRTLILSAASSWIDATVNIFNKMGWTTELQSTGAQQLRAPLIF
jgi:hypothetical protein